MGFLAKYAYRLLGLPAASEINDQILKRQNNQQDHEREEFQRVAQLHTSYILKKKVKFCKLKTVDEIGPTKGAY